MKICNRCQKTKEYSEFYLREKGSTKTRPYCKECEHEYRRLNKEQRNIIKSKMKKAKPNNKELSIEDIEKKRELRRARNIRYRSTEKGKEAQKRSTYAYMNRFPEQFKASKKLQSAVKYGKIKKPDTCSICNIKFDRIEGHHHDYSKPLDVIWCCVMCHKATHKKREA